MAKKTAKQTRLIQLALTSAPIWSVAKGEVVAWAANERCAVPCLTYLPDGEYMIGGDDHSYSVDRASGEIKVYRDGRYHVCTAPLDQADDAPAEWKFARV